LMGDRRERLHHGFADRVHNVFINSGPSFIIFQ
jgi:hypothetical protein